MIKKTVVIILLATMFLSSCKVQSSVTVHPTATSMPFCNRSDVEKAANEFNELITYFVRVNENVTKGDLSDLDKTMSEVLLIREKVNKVIVPLCLKDSQSYLVEGLDYYYEGLKNVKMKSSDWYISEKFELATEQFDKFNDELLKALVIVSD